MEKERLKRVKLFLGFEQDVTDVKFITRIAILVAIAALLKTYLNLDLGVWRLTFYGIPLIILGMTMGPLAGVLGGLAADFAYIMYKGFLYGINIFTISAVMWGLIPAIILFKRGYSFRRLIVTVVLTSTVVFILNTVGLVQLWGTTQLVFLKDFVPGPLFFRVVTYLVKLPIQVYVIHVLITRLHQAYPELELILE